MKKNNSKQFIITIEGEKCNMSTKGDISLWDCYKAISILSEKCLANYINISKQENISTVLVDLREAVNLGIYSAILSNKGDQE